MMIIAVDSQLAGLIASGHVEPVVGWVTQPDGRRAPGEQEKDDAGHPMWTVHALLMSDDRPMTVGVRVPSAQCPQPTALQPVHFERLRCEVKVNKKTGQLLNYWDAAGIVTPRAAARGQEQAG